MPSLRCAMAKERDHQLAEEFTAHRAKAHAHLRHEMDALGMTAAEGWRIAESTREVVGGLEMVLRPIHRYLPSPPGLECIVRIETPVEVVESECHPTPIMSR